MIIIQNTPTPHELETLIPHIRDMRPDSRVAERVQLHIDEFLTLTQTQTLIVATDLRRSVRGLPREKNRLTSSQSKERKELKETDGHCGEGMTNSKRKE